MKLFRTILIVFCISGLLLAGCQGPAGTVAGSSPDADITVAFVPKLTGNAFFEAANKGAQAYAAQHGFQVEYAGSPVADVSNQVEIVRGLIKRGVPAICISSLDATALDDVLKEAMDAGIRVVTWDSDVSGDARALMVSQGTPEQLGKMLVEMGAKSLTNRGIDPSGEEIRYAWHYSRPSVADQNSWQEAGEEYIRSTYPNWVNVNPGNYYSGQDPEKAVLVGGQILEENPDIDLIICNDSTALPGQAEAARGKGMGAEDVTITGFASPNAMKDYCEEGVIERWGLWDCQVQGALGCYLAYYLAAGNTVEVGEEVDVPGIGLMEVMPNTVLDPAAYTAKDSGTVLLPSRLEFTKDNLDKYDF